MIYNFAIQEFSSSFISADLSTGVGSATIEIYDKDSSLLALSDNSLTEISTTGFFLFDLSKVTTPPVTYTQYFYKISRGAVTSTGQIDVGSQEWGLETCKVSLSLREPNGDPMEASKIYSSKNKIFAEIQSTFYQNSTSTYVYKCEIKPDFNATTSVISWLLPRSSSVKFFISILDINSVYTIPDQSEISFYDLSILT